MGNRRLGPRFRRKGLPKRKNGRFRLWILLCAAFFLLFGAFSERGLSSVSEELTREAAKGYLAKAVNRAVTDSLEGGEASFQKVCEQEGQVSAVSTDIEALNQLKSHVLSKLSESLNGTVRVSVPVGSLTNIGLLSGRGFPVPLRLKLEGSADVAFQTEFLSAGVNQTCHRVTMVVRAQAFSQSRRFETYAQHETSTVLCETVIVGEVPQYLSRLDG